MLRIRTRLCATLLSRMRTRAHWARALIHVHGQVIYVYTRMYILSTVPCFHSFAERSKELCRRGIKSLNNATMKEGSIGTRNCTVNTEKNVVVERMADEGMKELRKRENDYSKKKRNR